MTQQARLPLPDQICAYGDEDSFACSRKESGQWVFWDDRVELILTGRYQDVKPLHVELSPTYLCNFACPWCSCRSAREDWSGEDVFHHPEATPSTVMDYTKADRILQHLSQYRIGIQWVGGEPTMNPLLYTMVSRAAELGLSQCLFTNGSLLHANRLDALLDAGLVFIRVSLNAVTQMIHQRFHNYRADLKYGRRVIRNLHLLAKQRFEKGAETLIGVSMVVNRINIDDVIPTAHVVNEICKELGPRAIDFVILRPVYPFYSAQENLSLNTIQRLQNLISPSGQVYSILAEVGVGLVVPDASLTRPSAPVPAIYGPECLAAGWFREIKPNGDMVVCADRYGNPDYIIGNLAQAGIDEIWAGERRRKVLQLAQEISCFHHSCPRNGRGFYLNNVFHEIECYRRAGQIGEVIRWIKDLQCVLNRPSHSFFL